MARPDPSLCGTVLLRSIYRRSTGLHNPRRISAPKTQGRGSQGRKDALKRVPQAGIAEVEALEVLCFVNFHARGVQISG